MGNQEASLDQVKAIAIVAIILVAAIAVGLFWVGKQARQYPLGPGMEQFKSATEKLGLEGERATGNTPKAIELADRMRKIMEAMRKRYFSEGSSNPIGVYCQLNEDSCAFLIYVPGLYRAHATGKQQLAEMAWVSAQPLFRHLPQRPTRLAVGLRDNIPYDVVWVGRVTDDPLADPEEKHTGINCRTEIYSFFAQE